MKTLFALLFCAALCYAEYAKPGDFPYFALCQDTDEEYCAGIILTEELVVVSDACINSLDSTDGIFVTVGEVEINDQSKTYKARPIKVAEKYQNDTRAEDIVFLAVSEKFEFNSNIQPAKEIYKSNGNETFFKIVGFESDKMEYFMVPAMEKKDCRAYLTGQGEKEWDHPLSICTRRTSKEPYFGYLLASEDDEPLGLGYYFSMFFGPDVFIEIKHYMDIIKATITDYENTK